MSAGTDVALAAAARGWHVFPLQAGSNKPRPGWKWARWHTTDPDLIRQWWAGGGNVGIACGPSRLVVIDLDTSGALPPPWDTLPGVVDGSDVYAVLAEAHDDGWPATYTVRTPRHGWHLYFAAGSHGIRNSAREVGPMIDVRGDGGCVAAAGSARPEGAYEVIDDTGPAPLPAWLARLAGKPPAEPAPRSAPAGGHSGAYVRAAVQAEARAVATAANGQRNDQLNRSAWSLARFVRDGQLDAGDLAGTLIPAALDAGLTPAEARRTIASALKGRRA